MQLLVLKMLYILFTSKGTSEYFYTNDMCVLVDVFLREVVDLDEESESVSTLFKFNIIPYFNHLHSYDTPIFGFFIPYLPRLNCELFRTNGPRLSAHWNPLLLMRTSGTSTRPRNG